MSNEPVALSTRVLYLYPKQSRILFHVGIEKVDPSKCMWKYLGAPVGPTNWSCPIIGSWSMHFQKKEASPFLIL